jgi:5-(carboxyamino)imidazole ribonucleotide synthase
VTDLTIGIVGRRAACPHDERGRDTLGLRVRLLAEAPQTAAAQVVPGTTVGDYADAATLSASPRTSTR